MKTTIFSPFLYHEAQKSKSIDIFLQEIEIKKTFNNNNNQNQFLFESQSCRTSIFDIYFKLRIQTCTIC